MTSAVVRAAGSFFFTAMTAQFEPFHRLPLLSPFFRLYVRTTTKDKLKNDLLISFLIKRR